MKYIMLFCVLLAACSNDDSDKKQREDIERIVKQQSEMVDVLQKMTLILRSEDKRITQLERKGGS